MGIESKPYYWITCDAPKCGGRSPSGDYEVNAWDDQYSAESTAVDEDWQNTPDGWLCDVHPRCETCGDLTAAGFLADDEPICRACSLKAAAS